MRRYPYIDVARGIGMVLVVAGHAMGISMYLTCFFMQLFFVLSGYVYRQGKSYKQNMKRKKDFWFHIFWEVLCCWEYIKYLAAQQRKCCFRVSGYCIQGIAFITWILLLRKITFFFWILQMEQCGI